MIKIEDFTKMAQDFMGAVPFDNKAAQDMFKSTAALGEKMSKVAFEAAEKSTAISSKWANENLAKMATVATAKDDPKQYTAAMTEYASGSAQIAAENMAAFAEIAKKVQMETVELMMSAGKDMGKEATSAVKKATKSAS